MVSSQANSYGQRDSVTIEGLAGIRIRTQLSFFSLVKRITPDVRCRSLNSRIFRLGSRRLAVMKSSYCGECATLTSSGTLPLSFTSSAFASLWSTATPVTWGIALDRPRQAKCSHSTGIKCYTFSIFLTMPLLEKNEGFRFYLANAWWQCDNKYKS